MQILVQIQSGRKLSIEVAGTDTVEELREKIYAQDAQAHPDLQLLALAEGGTVLEDGHALAEYGLRKESELRLGVRPAAEAIALCVGGVQQVTTLETLLSVPGSKLHSMFADVPQGGAPCFPKPAAQGTAAGAVAESVLPPPLRPAAGPLPQVSDRPPYVIDRDPVCFGRILNYLRRGAVVLPGSRAEVEDLKAEAAYFGLPELETACEASLRGICSLASLAAACEGGVTVSDIVALATGELKELLRQQNVNVVVAKRIEQEIADERERRRAAEEAERARLLAAEEQGRAVAALGGEMALLHVELSNTGLCSLVTAGLAVAEIRKLSAEEAEALGLCAEDARKIDALEAVAPRMVKTCGDNNRGQLGNGSTTDRAMPVEAAALGRDNAQIAAGCQHTVVLKEDGRVMACGRNNRGQLGDGSTTDRAMPVEVAALGRDNAQIAAGYEHTVVLKEDGRVMAFGANGSGQLGDGSTTDRAMPVEVAALGRDNAQIAAGKYHTVVLKEDGRVMAFGANGRGQLGDGSTTDRAMPVEVAALGRDNAQIAAGCQHTVVLKEDGRVMAFGANGSGQLGDGSTTDRAMPVEVAALGRDNAQIAAGSYHTVVLKEDGRVMAFGANGRGQLGDGSTTDRAMPVEVAALGRDNAQIAAGSYHTVVLKEDGRVMAFGANARGQLGDGSTTDRAMPVEVAALGRDNAQIAAGWNHTVVLGIVA